MRVLGLALYAEGPTDYRFLRPILQRLCEDLCLKRSDAVVEVNEVLGLNHSSSYDNSPREDRIIAAATEARGAWNILFVHADGSPDALRALTTQVMPALARIENDFSPSERGVAVMPVRETEAWALVDGEALRCVWGTRLTDTDLELPQLGSDIERIGDPKLSLKTAYLATNPPEKRRREGPAPYLTSIAEAVSLDRLRALEAFAKLEKDLTRVLIDMRFIK